MKMNDVNMECLKINKNDVIDEPNIKYVMSIAMLIDNLVEDVL